MEQLKINEVSLKPQKPKKFCFPTKSGEPPEQRKHVSLAILLRDIVKRALSLRNLKLTFDEINSCEVTRFVRTHYSVSKSSLSYFIIVNLRT